MNYIENMPLYYRLLDNSDVTKSIMLYSVSATFSASYGFKLYFLAILTEKNAYLFYQFM